jgi:Fur family transcriptional regulator, peroxide stress response regulator
LHVHIRSVTTVRRTRDEVARWCVQFERRCRAAGLRVTAQRLAVYRALAEDPSHPTADSVYAHLRRRMPALSRTTVYRILESLEREGFIRRVSTMHGVARFDPNLSAHQHLVCRICQRMIDVDAPALRTMTIPSEVAGGFVAEHLDIRIVGCCPDCRGATRGARGRRPITTLEKGRRSHHA